MIKFFYILLYLVYNKKKIILSYIPLQNIILSSSLFYLVSCGLAVFIFYVLKQQPTLSRNLITENVIFYTC